MSSIAAIHVAKKQLGLDDDTYRSSLVRVTGKDSVREMSEAERQKVIAAFRERGFKPASTGTRKGLEGKFAKKLQALWIAGWNLGIVRDRDDKALIAFVERQTGISHVRFLHHAEDAIKAIEGLKGWLARTAGVDWSVGDHLPDWMRMPGAQIALAQWQLLVRAGKMEPKIASFRNLVAVRARPVDQMTDRDWPIVMNVLGEMVREGAKP